ncbi:MAG: adenine deaminase C-terminal domain-containing protein, partial [Dehalococcoidia bacterium]|nr:adenine deaminase C-terminal domain-containing protein [Dehalococcoidia bacterium]
MILKKSLEESLALMKVAQGQRTADAYIAGGKVVNVYSGEVLEANVAICGRRIAYVGSSQAMVGPQTNVIDATGYYLAPGYIDPHFHPDTYGNPHTSGMAVLPHGTTALFSNSSYLPRIFSPSDFERCMEELADLPVTMFCGVPEQKFYYPQEEEYSWEELDRLLDRPSAFGYNEIGIWTRLLEGDEKLLRKILLAKSKGKKADGHTGGCSYDKLNAVADAGITSCHESLVAREALDRLRLGFWVMLRESSSRRDLDRLLPIIIKDKVSTNRLMLTADGLTAPDLAQRGHLDYLIRKAISAGVEPVAAYRMASLNPATYHDLDGDLGGIAPGRLADILFLRDLGEPTPHMVMAKGVLAAKEGELLIDFPIPQYYDYARNRHRDPGNVQRVSGDMFMVPATGREALFPVMEVVNPVINRRVDRVIASRDGYLWADPEADLLKVAMVDLQAGRITTAFLSGFGAPVGGMASTANAAYKILVVGCSETDMALAVNRILEMRGGIAITQAGSVIHELALPLGGLMSLEPISALAIRASAMNEYLASLGFKLGDPYYFFSFLPSTFFPDLRMTVEGLYDVKRGKILVRPRD